MIIIPAIDLHNGTCVRLKQGQFNQITQFDELPIERAATFAKTGAQRLHVVDLDGAKTGVMQQLPLICAMQETGITVQAGGGIRSMKQATQCFESGISQIVLGSIAISNPDLTTQIIKEINPDQIILALDVHLVDGQPIPAIHGWQKSSNRNLWELVSYYQNRGVKQILCTDIACDGMMGGPNFALYQQAVDRFPDIAWQASGGIRNQEDIKLLAASGIAAVILGLTLYEGNFDLESCLKEYAS